MAQIPASRGVQTQKLDEIIRKLESQPSVDDWHEMATVLGEVSTTMRAVEKKVSKLDEVVITGNGRDPLVQRMTNVERAVAVFIKAAWIVVASVLTTGVGIFIYLSQSHTIP